MSECKHEWSKGKMFYGKSDCPYCEINRLKAELEDAKDEAFKREARIMMYANKNSDIKRQLDVSQALLAEARAEVERLKEFHASGRYTVEQTDKGVRICYGHHEKHDRCEYVEYVDAGAASKEAARECLEIFGDFYDEFSFMDSVKEIKAKFGLEG